jgi:hypothetical protein
MVYAVEGSVSNAMADLLRMSVFNREICMLLKKTGEEKNLIGIN